MTACYFLHVDISLHPKDKSPSNGPSRKYPQSLIWMACHIVIQMTGQDTCRALYMIKLHNTFLGTYIYNVNNRDFFFDFSKS